MEEISSDISSSIWNQPNEIFSQLQSTMKPKDEIILGIDFGTSNSCVSFWHSDKNRVKIVKNVLSNLGKITPSTVKFGKAFTEIAIGSTDPQNLIQGIKHLLGLSIDQATQSTNNKYNYHLVPSGNDPSTLAITCQNEDHESENISVEELISYILKSLRVSVNDYLRRKPVKSKPNLAPITKVVLGTPAIFPESKREALKRAAMLAGFEEIHFMIESTAAAMAYGLLVSGSKHVLVLDIGGGTTDISLLNIDNGTHNVLYTAGNSQLGGQDIDLLLTQYIITQLTKRIESLNETSIHSDQNIYNQIIFQCKQCKEMLSEEDEYILQFPKELFAHLINESTSSSKKKQKSTTIDIIITRKEFEYIIQPINHLIEETFVHHMTQFLSQTPLTIDEVVLVGGTSRIPSLRSALRHGFDRLPGHNQFGLSLGHKSKDFCTSISPELSVVEGLAIRGAILSGENTNRLKTILMMDCLPLTIGILVKDKENLQQKYFEPLLPQGSKLPIETTSMFIIENPKQRYVSLEIYEEMEEIRPLKPKEIEELGQEEDNDDDNLKDKNTLVVNNNIHNNKYRVDYSYSLLLSVDVLIESLHQQEPKEGDVPQEEVEEENNLFSRSVQVIFHVDEEGVLSYSAKEIPQDINTTNHPQRKPQTNIDIHWFLSKEIFPLTMTLFMLLVIYLVCKYHLFPNISLSNHMTSSSSSIFGDSANMFTNNITLEEL